VIRCPLPPALFEFLKGLLEDSKRPDGFRLGFLMKGYETTSIEKNKGDAYTGQPQVVLEDLLRRSNNRVLVPIKHILPIHDIKLQTYKDITKLTGSASGSGVLPFVPLVNTDPTLPFITLDDATRNCFIRSNSCSRWNLSALRFSARCSL
jgi:hypothetical protein